MSRRVFKVVKRTEQPKDGGGVESEPLDKGFVNRNVARARRK